MTPLATTLQYILLNISIIIQWILFIVGLILVIAPIYLTIAKEPTTFLKATQVCKERLGMHLLINLYFYKSIESAEITLSENTRSVIPTADATETYKPSKSQVDTEVCLLSNSNSGFVPGLVNTGNSCFLNSVLQSLSSLPKLQIYLNDIDKSPKSSNLDLPVTRSLLRTLKLLSVSSTTAFKPVEIVSAMSSNLRVINREQQDAQELFQLISGELDNESQLVKRKQGFRDILNFFAKDDAHQTLADNPFTGLLANRLSCMQCGYTEAIRHFSFNNVQLTLPNSDSTSLDDCLKQLTTIEHLHGVTCRKCSLTDTVAQLDNEIAMLQSIQKSQEKLLCLQKIKQNIEHRLAVGRIEEENHDELKGFLSKIGRVSSKQAMFAKPPKVLCLHIARSAFLPTGEIYKNTCQIKFPELLDLSPYCTNGNLNTQPNMPISADSTNTVKYKLMSSIVHYGSHNYGHFIAYKRRLVAEKCGCSTCGDNTTTLHHHDSDWFKISDERVDSCSVDEVLVANPYMLLYELIDEYDDKDEHSSRIDTQVVTNLSTVILEQEVQEDDDKDWITDKSPIAPPSSPLILPLQLNSSITTSCSVITMPQRRLRSNKKDLWTKTPVVIC